MRYFTLILVLLTTTYASGQAVLFNKIYPKPTGGGASAVIERHDGKYLIAGGTSNPTEFDDDINLLLVDSVGNLIWDKVIEKADAYESTISLMETSDYNYLISGLIWPYNLPYLLLFDSDGNAIWDKEYPQGILGDGAFSIGETEGGDFFFVESSQSYMFLSNLFTTLYNVSETGETNWTKEYDFANLRSVIRTTDNGFALVGITYDSTMVVSMWESEIILVKTNSEGDTLWSRTYASEQYTNAYAVRQTADDGYIIAGFYENPLENMEYSRARLIKTNSEGDTLWTQKYDSLGEPYYIAPCVHSSGYIMSSWRYVQGELFSPDTFFLQITKLNTAGDIEWTREFDGGIREGGNNVTETSDGGFLLTGVSEASSYAPGNILLIKLDSIGDFVISTNFPVGDKSANISVYPNPASEFITFKLNENDKGIREISIYNINGQKVKAIHNQLTNEVEVEINDFANGIYFYEITSSAKERFAGKFVVNK